MILFCRYLTRFGILILLLTLLKDVGHTMSEQKEKAPQYTNQLIEETSPYLLQHAHNPVDWFPWGRTPHWRRRERKTNQSSSPSVILPATGVM